MIETKKGFIRVTVINIDLSESVAWLRQSAILAMSRNDDDGGAWVSLRPDRQNNIRIKETLEELFEVFDEPEEKGHE